MWRGGRASAAPNLQGSDERRHSTCLHCFSAAVDEERQPVTACWQVGRASSCNTGHWASLSKVALCFSHLTGGSS